MKKTFFTLFVMLSMLWSMGASAQTLVFHLADGTTADVELSSTFRMSTVGSKTIVSLPDGSTKEFTQSDILTVTYRETRGDVNRDNAVDVADISTIISIMAGEEESVNIISVTTEDATDITASNAQLKASLSMNDITKNYTYGFFITTNGTPSSDNYTINEHRESDTVYSGFSMYVYSLFANTTYYYRAYVLYDDVYYYGETKSFKTDPISVTTKDATNVESTSAFLESLFTLEANTNSYTAGFFITTSGTPSSEIYWKNVFSKESEIYYGIGIYATELSPSTTYFFRAYILYNGVYYYGETKSFTTKAIVGYLTCPDSNHPHMINLGLPSGTLWACCNVGASSPGAFGNFYAWQDTEPKSDYSWDNYWHTYVQSSSGNYLYGARSNIAGTSDDAATANWGRPWQMPTKEQCQELIDNCSSVTTTQNGNSGHKLTGPNGGSIFLPSAGYCQNKGHFYYNGDSSSGFYWTSMLNESATQAYTLHFMTSCETEHCSASSPNCGLSVRPVRKE